MSLAVAQLLFWGKKIKDKGGDQLLKVKINKWKSIVVNKTSGEET